MLRHFKILMHLRPSTNRLLFANMSSSSISNTKVCQIKEEDGVREIILNDPKTRNALSLTMMNEILNAIAKTWDDTKLRCILLSSTGPTWSAGHNLKELLPECGAEQQSTIFKKLTEIIYSIRAAPVPVIAKVNGVVAAAGVQLVASCDMVVCSTKSSFVMPSANIGVFASTPAVSMSRILSHSKCLDMLMTGHPISAEEAFHHGLASRVVPEDKIDEEINEIVCAIKNKSRKVLALGKDYFYSQLDLPLKEAYEQGEKKMIENLELKDTEEGIRSFFEKRKPVWSHM